MTDNGWRIIMLDAGIWHLASGIWHLASGIWHLASGTWHPLSSIQYLCNILSV